MPKATRGVVSPASANRWPVGVVLAVNWRLEAVSSGTPKWGHVWRQGTCPQSRGCRRSLTTTSNGVTVAGYFRNLGHNCLNARPRIEGCRRLSLWPTYFSRSRGYFRAADKSVYYRAKSRNSFDPVRLAMILAPLFMTTSRRDAS